MRVRREASAAEASTTGQFRPPPGYDYTTTNWNFYTPIVGGGGPNAPAEKMTCSAVKVRRCLANHAPGRSVVTT